MALDEKQIKLLTQIYEGKSARKINIPNMVEAFRAGGCEVVNDGDIYKFSYNGTTINRVRLTNDKPPEIKSLDKAFSRIACSELLDNDVKGFIPDYMKQPRQRGFDSITNG